MISINISDLHFGKMNPKIQYDLLYNQFILKIQNIQMDFVCISGDLFDHKMYAENDGIMYAIKFVNDVLSICEQHDAKLIVIKGTASHDSDQLKLLYHILTNHWRNFAIVETIGIVEHKGYRVLCIPEEHGLPVETYNQYLFNSGFYDMVIFHGLLKNSCYGANVPTIDTQGPPIFDISHFYMCKGPIIGGHIHVANCFQTHMYYTGSPYRWCFGEEEAKGFIVMAMDDISLRYMVHFEPIMSFSYVTVDMDDIFSKFEDPKDVVDHIKLIMTNRNIDYIRIKLSKSSNLIPIVKQYFKNNTRVNWLTEDIAYYEAVQSVQQSNDQFKEYEYLLDSSKTPEEKLALYINNKEGFAPDSEMWLTGKDIIDILSDNYDITTIGTN